MMDLGTLGEPLRQEVKLWLRITGTAMDSEVDQTIRAGLMDLRMAGVAFIDPQDSLIQQAVKLYCKAQFGYEADSAKFAAAYEHLKSALTLCNAYREVPHG